MKILTTFGDLGIADLASVLLGIWADPLYSRPLEEGKERGSG